MPRRPSPQPTEFELEILRILWQRGASCERRFEMLAPGRLKKEKSDTHVGKVIQVLQLRWFSHCHATGG